MACSGWFQSGDMGRKDAAYSGLYWVSDSCRDGEIFVRVLILFFSLGFLKKLLRLVAGRPAVCSYSTLLRLHK